jgi:hypothetical protein
MPRITPTYAAAAGWSIASPPRWVMTRRGKRQPDRYRFVIDRGRFDEVHFHGTGSATGTGTGTG